MRRTIKWRRSSVGSFGSRRDQAGLRHPWHPHYMMRSAVRSIAAVVVLVDG